MKLSDFSITNYGIFDSNVAFPKVVQTPNRIVNVYELELITADCLGSTFIDGTHIPLKAGTVIFAKPGQVRRSVLPFKCLYLHIYTTDSTLCSILDQIPDCSSVVQMQDMTELFHEMIRIESSQMHQDTFLLHSCALRLLHLTSQLRSAPLTNPGNSILHQKRLLDIESYIRSHISEDLSLSALASICNLSPTYFHRLFTDYFRKTPSDYILDFRIATAKQYLLSGEYTLSEIGCLCGFSTQTYFCYKFKQATGKTPTEYRKEMLGRLNIF